MTTISSTSIPKPLALPPRRGGPASAPSSRGDGLDLGRPLRDDPPAHNPQPGSDSMGDPYYPKLGNGGYQASHYTINMKVDPASNQVSAVTTMDAKATQDLSAFNLDFKGFDISKISVNGQDAGFSRQDGELTVNPSQPLLQGDDFNVAVHYSGDPQPVPSAAFPHTTVGWKNFGNGISIDCEPDGASAWFPCNDHPRNKSSYSFVVEVPKGYNVAANGKLVDTIEGDGTNTFVWEAKEPMASYLATVHIGDYKRQDDVGPDGIPIINYFPSDKVDKCTYDFGRTGEMIDHFSGLFGKFPFERYGNLVVGADGLVGGALECQTMSIFDPVFVTGDRSFEFVVAHELTHQWFGDSISVKNWKDLWLNEGFASYGQWLWQEKTDGLASVDQSAQQAHEWLKARESGDGAQEVPDCVRKLLLCKRGRSEEAVEKGGGMKIGEPPPNDLFDKEVYVKGGLALYALRKTVGDDNFFGGLKTYFQTYTGKNAEIADFIGVMEDASKQDLKPFFDSWLYSEKVPDLPTRAAK